MPKILKYTAGSNHFTVESVACEKVSLKHFLNVTGLDAGMEMGGLGSRRASQVVEQLPLESTTDAPTQRRKKKKKAATVGED